jgi:hypothetical protein
MLLMERGLIGTALFLIPWFTVTAKAWLLPAESHGRSVALLLMVMSLYSFWNFSLTYFLPFWLAFGVAASLVNPVYSEETLESPVGAGPRPMVLDLGYSTSPTNL